LPPTGNSVEGLVTFGSSPTTPDFTGELILDPIHIPTVISNAEVVANIATCQLCFIVCPR
jgi:hypothetical protein